MDLMELEVAGPGTMEVWCNSWDRGEEKRTC